MRKIKTSNDMDQLKRLLVVDDEEDLCEILMFNLKGEGYDVDVAYSAEEALGKLKENEYSLILLDVMMDGMSGFNMAETLRNDMKIDVPIIFLTAKDTENDMLTGFSVGADDYISKPFSIKEVQARVKAVLKRYEGSVERQHRDNAAANDGKPDKAHGKKDIQVGNLRIDVSSKSVFVEDVPVNLTKKEFEILSMLASSPGTVYSRAEILGNVWPDDVFVLERTVDVHITSVIFPAPKTQPIAETSAEQVANV